MLTGETFDADAARQMGLSPTSAATSSRPSTTSATASCQGAPTAVAATKRLLHTVPAMDREPAFEAMAVLSNDLFNSADAAEGMAAFAEKRSPTWSRSVR